MNVIDTDAYSAQLRARAVDTTRRALLITDLRGSAQEGDLSEPVNCGGYGRIRHFTAATPPRPATAGRRTRFQPPRQPRRSASRQPGRYGRRSSRTRSATGRAFCMRSSCSPA